VRPPRPCGTDRPIPEEIHDVSGLINVLMRLYRKSPFYPRLGKRLARCLSFLTRLRGNHPVVREIGGITYELNLQEVIDASLYYSGTFEADAEKTIETLVKPGTVSIDIGANFGYHTFRMARSAGAGGRVLAIEPTTWAYDKLQRNAALNDFTTIDYVKVGLSDADLGNTEIAFQSSYRLDGQQADTLETVRLTTLDTVVREQQLDRVDFIKMDVDGFEGRVLRGAVETLRAHRPMIFFELSPAAMKDADDDALELMRLLEGLGYEFQDESQLPIRNVADFCAAIPFGYSVNLLALPALVAATTLPTPRTEMAAPALVDSL
jgi:FkbM family methyltransferase